MMSKALKPATIIPQELYVPRDADRQLRRVLEDMGRPGYILVSRQMGKTNLLLNAKRELESPSCIFVYVDLSNKFDTSKECFRNIIDIAINTNFCTFSEVDSKVASHRNNDPNVSAHKEHERELLTLLRSYSGKLVIVLDEIDALVNTEYSDQFFAQIRSVYFSRANYPEFSRLTYILSGVVEPSKIIKDRNRSPFNIGEKIYLDDFTEEEYHTFISKLHPFIVERCGSEVFAWTNGHPRMTWDICSALEDVFIANGSIDASDVSSVVKRLYLDNFDTAPIDHIRDLAQQNIEIRRAVREIWAGKTSIGESVKKKLYLAGVIKSDLSSAALRIKNKIIEEALSLSWLEGLDRSNMDLLSIGNEQKTIGNYGDAIKYYTDFVKEFGTDDEDLCNAIYFDIAFCYSKLFEFEKSLSYFLKRSFDKNIQPSQYYNNLLDIGLSFFNLERYDEAMEAFKEVISESKPSIVRIKAAFNYAGCLMRQDFQANKVEALSWFKELLQEIGEINFSDLNEPKEIKIICYYNIGYIAECDGDIDSAKENYQHALKVNVPQHLPGLYCRLLSLERDQDIKERLAQEVVDTIILNKLVVDDMSHQNPIAFSSYILFSLLLHLYQCSDSTPFRKFYDYTNTKLYTYYEAPFELLLALGNVARGSRRHAIAVSLYNEVLKELELFPDIKNRWKILLGIKRSLCICKASLGHPYASEYVEYKHLLTQYKPVLVDDDFKAFSIHIIHLRNQKKYEEALDNLAVLDYYQTQTGEKEPGLAGVLFLKAQIYDLQKKKRLSWGFAQEVLNLLESYDPEKCKSITVQESNIIKDAAEKLIAKNSNFLPASSTKIGRNDFCRCGSGQKYKKCCGK